MISSKDIVRFIEDAAAGYSPALIANYAYELAREYNQFYQEINILREKDEAVASFRLNLSSATARVLSTAMGLLGIEVPDRM